MYGYMTQIRKIHIPTIKIKKSIQETIIKKQYILKKKTYLDLTNIYNHFYFLQNFKQFMRYLKITICTVKLILAISLKSNRYFAKGRKSLNILIRPTDIFKMLFVYLLFFALWPFETFFQNFNYRNLNCSILYNRAPKMYAEQKTILTYVINCFIHT